MSSNTQRTAQDDAASIAAVAGILASAATPDMPHTTRQGTIDTEGMDAIKQDSAPIVQPPVKTRKASKKGNVMSTSSKKAPTAPIVDVAKRDKAIAERRARQAAAIQASNTLSTHQKAAAQNLIARDSHGAVNPSVKVADGTIAKFQALIESRDPMAMALVPANYNVKPAWLSQKDFDKAKKDFNRQYDAHGPSAFDRDEDGRLILDLPMTTGRFVACVLAGDVSNVLRFAGAMKPSEDGTFYWLSRLDVTAPIVAAVYRAGAAFNRASKAYDKARESYDMAPSDKVESAGKRKDARFGAMVDARESFVRAYMAVFSDADTVKGLSDRADALIVAAQQALLAEQEKRDAASASVKGNAGTINTATAGK
jgi:hypothetical protein